MFDIPNHYVTMHKRLCLLLILYLVLVLLAYVYTMYKKTKGKGSDFFIANWVSLSVYKLSALFRNLCDACMSVRTLAPLKRALIRVRARSGE